MSCEVPRAALVAVLLVGGIPGCADDRPSGAPGGAPAQAAAGTLAGPTKTYKAHMTAQPGAAGYCRHSNATITYNEDTREGHLHLANFGGTEGTAKFTAFPGGDFDTVVRLPSGVTTPVSGTVKPGGKIAYRNPICPYAGTMEVSR